MAFRPAPRFAALLREWRFRRRFSQLELALAAGISQRHLSQLENGRARPGAATVLRLADALDLPLGARDALLAAAGYAPLSPSQAPDDTARRLVADAVSLVLRHSEPYPAVAVDAAWNVRDANRPFWMLIALLSGGSAPRGAEGPPLNLLRSFFDPAGLKPAIRNWDQIAPALWQRAARDAEIRGEPALADLLADLQRAGWAPRRAPAPAAPLLPVLPVVVAAGDEELAFITVVSTFGTPQDALAEEIGVETFYPADAATRAALHRLAGPAPAGS